MLAEFEAEIAAFVLADLPNFLPPLTFTHETETEAETDDTSALPSPAAHAQTEVAQSARNERVRKAREARRGASVKEQERRQAAAAAAAAAVHDERYDAPRARGAHGTRVYGRRYRPYPDALAGILSAREAPSSPAPAAPSKNHPAAPVVVEEVRVKVTQVEEVEPEERKVESPTVDDVGVKGAPQAAGTPTNVVDEVREPETTTHAKPIEAHGVEPANQAQAHEAVDSDDSSAKDDASEEASDSEEEEEEISEGEGGGDEDAGHVMPGDFFFSNPPPPSLPGLWPLGATIGVVSAVAFVR